MSFFVCTICNTARQCRAYCNTRLSVIPLYICGMVQEIAAFIRFIQFEKRFSPHSILSYTNDLEQFQVYLGQTSTPIADARHFHIRSWMVQLLKDGNTPRTINRKISSLKSFYKFMLRNNSITENPLAKVTTPKVSKRLPVFVEQKNIDQLLTDITFEEDYEGVRDKTLIELFYATGMRRSELVSIQTTDIDTYNSQVKVLGKGNKERILPLAPALIRTMQHYLAERKTAFEDIAGNALFLNKKGNALKDYEAYAIVKKYLSMVTTLDKKSPHVLRHTFATHMLNEGADINAVKELLGHSSLAATQVYTHNTIERLKSVHKQAHPRG
jgi:integrase/recombinase XerC